MGTAVIGGMLAATVIAIFLIPVTFDVVEKITHRVKHAKKRKKTEVVPEEQEVV
ncbi:MAG: hypothetical protein JO217_15020 [Acidobacteriaceae bacterium]|nr:hypothetical protein [Acidobacteriaceae bacterium]